MSNTKVRHLIAMLALLYSANGAESQEQVPHFAIRDQNDLLEALPDRRLVGTRAAMVAISTTPNSLLDVVLDPNVPALKKVAALTVLRVLRDSSVGMRLLEFARTGARSDPVAEESRYELIAYPYGPICGHHRTTLDTASSWDYIYSSAYGLGYCGTVADTSLLTRHRDHRMQEVRDRVEWALAQLRVPPEERWRNTYYWDSPPDGTGTYHPPPWVVAAIRAAACGDEPCRPEYPSDHPMRPQDIGPFRDAHGRRPR